MLKKLGAYFVGAGIVVTGVLWYDRKDGVVASEDMAALINRVMDVCLIGRLMGDDAPDYWGDGGVDHSFGSNIVKGAVVSMEDLRKLALRVEGLPQWQNPVWVDLAYSHVFEDGAEILAFTNRPVMSVRDEVFEYWDWGTSGMVSVPYVVREYRAVTPAPVSNVRTLSCRAWSGAMPFERGVSLTNSPVCRWLHPGAGFAFSYPMWPGGSSWTADMGAKAYTLPFRRNFSTDDYYVLARPFFLSGMRLVDGSLNTVESHRFTLPTSWGGPATVSVRTSGQPSSVQMCALVEIIAPDSPRGYSFATAGPFASPQLSPHAGSYAVELAPGPNVIQVRRNIQLPANGRLGVQVIQKPGYYMATGCSVYTNDTGVYDVHVHANPAYYDHTQAALLRVWLDVPGVSPVATHIAIGPPPSAMVGEPVRLSRFTAEVSLGAAGCSVSLQLPAGAVTAVYDRTVSTRGLDAVRAVITNCTVSAYSAPSPFKSAMHSVSGFESDYISVSGTGTFESNLGDLYSRIRCVSSNQVYAGAGDIFRINARARSERWDSDPLHFSGRVTYQQTVSKALGLAYPSAYAVTNGYVRKIRVFAVCGYTQTGITDPIASARWSPWVVFSKQFHAGGLPLRGLPYLSASDESGVVKASDASGVYEDHYNAVNDFRGITLNKVHEVSNPTSASDLSFTWHIPPVTPEALTSPTAHGIRPGNPSLEVLEASHSITINDLYYIIVVDWDFSGTKN